jgi:hypothetical protein
VREQVLAHEKKKQSLLQENMFKQTTLIRLSENQRLAEQLHTIYSQFAEATKNKAALQFELHKEKIKLGEKDQNLQAMLQVAIEKGKSALAAASEKEWQTWLAKMQTQVEQTRTQWISDYDKFYKYELRKARLEVCGERQKRLDGERQTLKKQLLLNALRPKEIMLQEELVMKARRDTLRRAWEAIKFEGDEQIERVRQLTQKLMNDSAELNVQVLSKTQDLQMVSFENREIQGRIELVRYLKSQVHDMMSTTLIRIPLQERKIDAQRLNNQTDGMVGVAKPVSNHAPNLAGKSGGEIIEFLRQERKKLKAKADSLRIEKQKLVTEHEDLVAKRLAVIELESILK